MSDANVERPLAVWKLLRDPILTIDKEGIGESRSNIKRLFTVIKSSCEGRKNWYIPPSQNDKMPREIRSLQDQEYTAFCTWILGRLLFYLHKDEILDLHKSCIEAQIQILNLCMKNQYMARFFFQEYLDSLSDIVEHQVSKKSLQDGPFVLKRFTPLRLEALEELNLIPDYILINTPSVLKRVENYLVEILCTVLEFVVHTNEDLVKQMWLTMCKIVWLGNLPAKVQALNFFSIVISRIGFLENETMMELYRALECVVKFYPQWQQQSLDSSNNFIDMKLAFGKILRAFNKSHNERSNETADRYLLSALCTLISTWELKDFSDPILEPVSKCIVVILQSLPPDSVDVSSFDDLLSKFHTQTYVVDIIETILYHKILNYLSTQPATLSGSTGESSTSGYQTLQLDIVNVCPAWSVFDQQLEQSLESTRNSLSKTLKTAYVQAQDELGKIHTVIRCAVGVDSLLTTRKEAQRYKCFPIFFTGKIRKLLNGLKSIALAFGSRSIQELDDEITRNLSRSLILSTAELFLLPEMENCFEEEISIGLSILSLPWSGFVPLLDLQIDPVLADLKNIENFKTAELQVLSLEALATVPHGVAPRWRVSLYFTVVDLFNRSGLKETPIPKSLVLQAIHSFPTLLADSKQNVSVLLLDILHPALQMEDSAILTAVSEIFALAVCVLAGDYVTVRVRKADGRPVLSHVCKLCCKDAPKISSQGRNVLTGVTSLLSSFTALLESPEVLVRRNMAASLSRLVLHLPVMHQPNIVMKWINYAEDSDSQVRSTFSQMVKFLIFHRDWMEGKKVQYEHLREELIPLSQLDREELSQSRPRLDRVLHLLVKILNKSLETKNQVLQDSILSTVVDIGCIPLDCVLLPVLRIVLMCVCHPKFTHPSLAHVYIKKIADSHNTKVEKLYIRFRSDICHIVITMAGMNYHNRTDWTRFMDKVVYGLGFKSFSSWIADSARDTVPFIFALVVKLNDHKFLDRIIEILNTDRVSLVKDYFQYVFPYVFLNEEDEIIKKCVNLMEEMSKLNAQNLQIVSSKKIHNTLLLHYCSNRSRVEKGICRLNNVVAEKEGLPHKSSLSAEEIAEHLNSRFLGVLVYFDNVLESSFFEESVKIKALQSLPEIIRLMGSKYITPVRFKVLSTLCTALRLTHCDFPHLSCNAWEAFIHSVELPELGPLLGTVVASLLPLLDQFPVEIAQIFRWLVVEREQELSTYIPDLFFLPNTPEINDVYEIVQRYLLAEKLMNNDSSNILDSLQQPLRFISHGNVDIRRHGLHRLRSILKDKQCPVTKNLLCEEGVHTGVAQLLNTLVVGCRDPDPDIRLLCVENLGLFGALDPGHFPRKIIDKDAPHIFVEVEKEAGPFCRQALIVLAKGFHSARHTRYLDLFAFAIQELLKHYNISSSPRNPNKQLWDSLPLTTQQVMVPLEDSCYIMVFKNDYPWPHPIFGTRYAPSLTRWAHCWACRLLKFSEESFAKTVFTACIPSLKTDINCVLFFLPFILLYAVFQDDHHKMIEEEMTYILQHRSLEEEDTVSDKLELEKFPVRTDKLKELPRYENSDSETHALCAKTVFSCLDFMQKWVGMSKKQNDNKKREKSSPTATPTNVQNVGKFLARFSKLDLAYGNYGVKEFARALMYLEDYLVENQDQLKNHLSFLGRIYAQLNEPDGIKGVMAVQCSEPSLLETVVYHEVTNQYQEALACYELLAQQHGMEDNLSIQKGMIRCCLNLDQPYAALSIAEGVLSHSLENRSNFLEDQAECFWRLHGLDKLEAVLNDPILESSSAWGVSIGRCLIDIRDGSTDKLMQHLQDTRSSLASALSTASLEKGNYLQGYRHIIRLHMLQELESAYNIICLIRSTDVEEARCISALQTMVEVWEHRFKLVEAVPEVQEPLLCLRRSLLQLAMSSVRPTHDELQQSLTKMLGQSWLKSAEIARMANCLQQSYVYLLNAAKYEPKRHFVVLAELHWVKGEQEHAFSALRRGIENHFPNYKEFKDVNVTSDYENRMICAEAKLLIANYNEEIRNVNLEVNMINYREAAEICRDWEKGYLHLARCYDSMISTEESLLDIGSSAEFQACAVITYAKSIKYGCNHIYQSMSRLLTIWLDYGKRFQDAQQTCKAKLSTLSKEESIKEIKLLKDRKKFLDQMNTCIANFVNGLPPYLFMTGFSQIASRICHPVEEVYEVIKNIIVKLLECYPQQTMWMLLCMFRSSHAQRRRRCGAILDDARIKQNSTLVRLIQDFLKLGNLFTDLCHKPVPKELKNTSVSLIVKGLQRTLSDPNFSKIMVPLQKYRTLMLPQFGNSSEKEHVPYAVNHPSIAEIKDEVIILTSLQRPRKITLRGTDGNLYQMMCKDRDDLRLDAKVMEFNSIVNKYLQKNQESRSRSLSIRTYSVVPLNEESGLIEWVPNLIGYRPAILKIYEEMGCNTPAKEMRKFIKEKGAPLEDKRETFLKELIPRHPSVFRQWLRSTFTDSCSWYEARKSFVYTTAVMSMVGYILGLGDRHGENILLDTTCGDVVHVDFNCLFNKGETFEWPECVPFRLTHNMVNAMGPTGIEGAFRHACEITLRVLRNENQTLSSVLQPFVYDPLHAWGHQQRNSAKSHHQEMTNECALQHVKKIKLRLLGMLTKPGQTAFSSLSVEGQTAFLIKEATDEDNLCRMYVGWMPFL